MAKTRRIRSPHEYARKIGTQEPYDFILIVCEGKKTEPNYFDGLKVRYRLSNANIVVASPKGSDPGSIVKCAREELSKDNYDRVYCVFDRDEHQNYDAAIRALDKMDSKMKCLVASITSNPCFEIWLLLHFKYSTASFKKIANVSACDKVIKELKKHHPEYQKGDRTAFAVLDDKVDIAIWNANKLHAHNESTNSINPSTRMHELVDYLRKLKAS